MSTLDEILERARLRSVERNLMARTLESIRKEFPIAHNTTYPGDIDHSYVVELLSHQIDVRVNLESGWWGLVVCHPYLCGCDSLTNEFVLHG